MSTATTAQTVFSPRASNSAWVGDFLREELAPYPGRMALVVRMMVAATLVMIVSMTFKLPQGAYGAVYALTLSRESPQATISAVKVVVVAFAIAAAWELNGAIFFTNEPVLRFGWLILTFFLMFYCLSALTNYTAAVRFGYLVIITTPLWDRHLSAETRVEQTLWAVLTLTVASVITAFVELIYAEFNRGSDLIKPISERLSCVENVLLAYADSRPVPQAAEKSLTRFAMAGMSRLRRTLQRSSYPSEYREQMGAVLTIVGRMVDIAANLTHLDIRVKGIDRQRILRLVENIASIRTDLGAGRAPANIQFDKNGAMSPVPLLREMEKTVALIRDVFLGCESLKAYGPPPGTDEPRAGLFRPDALSNADHIKFALKGGLAASLCYVIYNVIDWPGISTAVTTCFLTAQSTIGSSRQKQLLRIAGAIVGGLILGFGAQIFILPHLDSIAEFTVLFLAVTFIAAWFATSSPRLSYFGIQIAVAWYLINLQEFKIQTSLGVARDRVFGIFLGLMVMWLIFDQLWGAPAGVEMRRAFISNVRLLAQFIREPLSNDVGKSIDRNYALRETINAGFDKARFLADGVLLEFGSSRQQDLAIRSRIRQWQTQLRVIFVARTTLWKYRMRLPGFELPDNILEAQRDFDEEMAKSLDSVADRMEGKAANTSTSALDDSLEKLEHVGRTLVDGTQDDREAQLITLLLLSRKTEQLAVSLNIECEDHQAALLALSPPVAS